MSIFNHETPMSLGIVNKIKNKKHTKKVWVDLGLLFREIFFSHLNQKIDVILYISK